MAPMRTESQKIPQSPAYRLPPEPAYIADALGRFALHDGRLLRFYDAETGAPLDTSPIFEDFGDVAPFLWLIGRQDLANAEFEALKGALAADPVHVNPWRRSQWMISTYAWTDLMLGLLDHHRLAHSREALELADSVLAIWLGRFCRKGVAYGRGVKIGSRVVPLPFSTLIDIGMLPELLVNRACIDPRHRDANLLQHAHDIVGGWIADCFFERNGLFPNIFVDAPKRGGGMQRLFGAVAVGVKPEKAAVATLFKHNTNALASVLSVWKATGDEALLDAIAKWTDSCHSLLADDTGMIAMQWQEGVGIVEGPRDNNFQVVDLMCDVAHATGQERYLDMARSVADPWLARRSALGLIPHQLRGSYSGRAMSDSQTDFSVALLKLERLTGEGRYGQAATDIMDSVARHMYKRCGMVNWVALETGQTIDNVCKTKFFVLSVKAWLALANRERIYSDERFTELLSDR